MRNGNPVDLIGGILVALAGLFVLFYALAQYRLGTPQNMGPGYFPASLGSLTAVIGLVIIAMSFRVSASFPEIAWLSAFWIFVSIIGFIVGMIWLGMLPAVALTVIFSSLADRDSRPRETVLLVIAACVGTWLIFSVGLGLTAPPVRMPF
jgi:hypothetical protein